MSHAPSSPSYGAPPRAFLLRSSFPPGSANPIRQRASPPPPVAGASTKSSRKGGGGGVLSLQSPPPSAAPPASRRPRPPPSRRRGKPAHATHQPPRASFRKKTTLSVLGGSALDAPPPQLSPAHKRTRERHSSTSEEVRLQKHSNQNPKGAKRTKNKKQKNAATAAAPRPFFCLAPDRSPTPPIINHATAPSTAGTKCCATCSTISIPISAMMISSDRSLFLSSRTSSTNFAFSSIGPSFRFSASNLLSSS